MPLRQVGEQGWNQLRGHGWEQWKKSLEGLRLAEREQRIAQRRQQGEKVYRWGSPVRKGGQTRWGEWPGVRVPRLRGREEIGLIEKYQRHGWDEVLLALAVGGRSQRNVVQGARRLVGGVLSPATIGAVLREAEPQIQQRRPQPLSPPAYPVLVGDGVPRRYRRRLDRAAQPGVLLVAVGVQPKGRFQVRDGMAAPSETTEAYEPWFQRRLERGREQIQRILSDGVDRIPAAAQIVYPGADPQLCLGPWFRNLQAETPALERWQRRKLRREFWWLGEADDERPLRLGATSFCRRGRFGAPQMVRKFPAELPRGLAFLRRPPEWRHRLRTPNLAEGFFRPLRRYRSRFPGCRDAAPSEQGLGCYVLAAEPRHA